jgi:hypothetical protein
MHGNFQEGKNKWFRDTHAGNRPVENDEQGIGDFSWQCVRASAYDISKVVARLGTIPSALESNPPVSD